MYNMKKRKMCWEIISYAVALIGTMLLIWIIKKHLSFVPQNDEWSDWVLTKCIIVFVFGIVALIVYFFC